MSVTNFDRENFAEILKDTQGKQYDWFSAHAIRFVDKIWHKADLENRKRLSQAFPDVIEAYNYYYNHGTAFIPEDDR